jgi:hypothetical protein
MSSVITKARVYSIEVGDTQTKSGHIARLKANRVLLVPVESWKSNMLKV